jgi:hypothetical protein
MKITTKQNFLDKLGLFENGFQKLSSLWKERTTFEVGYIPAGSILLIDNEVFENKNLHHLNFETFKFKNC